MTTILAAGDEFVSPEVLVRAVRASCRDVPGGEPTFRTLRSGWPTEPFGPVGGVREASGTEDDVLAALGDAEVAVTQMAPFTKKVIAEAPRLKLISVCRGGPVNVDLQAATEAGIAVTFTPGRNAAAAAEFTIGLILAAMRRIPGSDAELKVGNWRGDYYAYENAGLELDGATVGLVGYGAIGSRMARVLRAFGARVLAYDPYATPESGVEFVELEELLKASSVVSLHARLTPETEQLINAEKLALLPHGAVLVNAARGGLLDYQPLPELLRSGKLGAVALDVYDIEPPPADWPLHDAPNVITTPHLGGATKQTAHRAVAIVADDVARFLRGESPVHLANPEVPRSAES
ncbi:MAG: hydroxyacid dehydrogenase [Pseudonocardiaceae bacterium]|nr:hydroxyacid dehydrogenase [Pseudonocardiaceae bacterium]